MQLSDSHSTRKIACGEQVELVQSYLAMVCTDLDTLQERHENVIQRIAYLKETLLAWEEEFQLKRNVKAKLPHLQAAEGEVDVKSKAPIDLRTCQSYHLMT